MADKLKMKKDAQSEKSCQGKPEGSRRKKSLHGPDGIFDGPLEDLHEHYEQEGSDAHPPITELPWGTKW